MSDYPDRLDWVETLSFHVVLEGLDFSTCKNIKQRFADAHIAVRPTTEKRYASIAFDGEKPSLDLVDFIRTNRRSFSDAFVSIWGSGSVSWGQYFVPAPVLAMAGELGIGLEVGFGVGARKRGNSIEE